MKSGPVSQSALKKIVALRRCVGLSSRLAYERGQKLLCARIFTTGNAHQIKNKDNQLGVQNQIKFAELAANANQRSVPEGKVDIGRTWKRAE